MNRRAFLLSTVAVQAIGLPAGSRPDRISGSQEPEELIPMNSLDRIGVQLYTVRDLLSNDYEGTIRTVFDAGYDEVETVWDPERSPDDIRDCLMK